jgi:NAD(P)-dependent dehydrogenase (short-subunit alcohol dehydrogenase family)
MLVFDINLHGSIHCTQIFGADMANSGWGRIINLGSLASVTAYGRDLAYVTSKTAIAGLTRVTAVDLGPKGVTANAICPGNIMTDMMRHVAVEVEARDGLEPGSFLDIRAKEIPARRLGTPSDIAAVASFLCRNDAEYVNGQLLHVNGGLHFG